MMSRGGKIVKPQNKIKNTLKKIVFNTFTSESSLPTELQDQTAQ